jgi:hypothetical protein
MPTPSPSFSTVFIPFPRGCSTPAARDAFTHGAKSAERGDTRLYGAHDANRVRWWYAGYDAASAAIRAASTTRATRAAGGRTTRATRGTRATPARTVRPLSERDPLTRLFPGGRVQVLTWPGTSH